MRKLWNKVTKLIAASSAIASWLFPLATPRAEDLRSRFPVRATGQSGLGKKKDILIRTALR